MSQSTREDPVATADAVDRASTAERRAMIPSGWAARFAVPVAFVAMVLFFGLSRAETFLTWATVQDLLNQAAIPVILAAGITFTLSVGEFDLSFTAVFGLSAAVVMVLVANEGFSTGLSCVVAIVMAVVVGLAVGTLVTATRASSFIVTLALGSVLSGLEIMLTDNQNIYRNVPESFSAIASTELAGLRAPVWVSLVVTAAAIVLLHATKFGRHVYAVGGNARAAYIGGVRVRKVRVYCFVLLGTLAGLGAILATAKTSSYYPNISGGLLLSTYAAVFLGAAMSPSNRFTVAGSALGVVWLLTLQTGLTQLNQPAWVSTLVQGLVLASAVLIAARGRKGNV